MSTDLFLVAAMGLGLVTVAWLWVPPRRGSGLEPAPPAPPPHSDPAQNKPVFADLVMIGAVVEQAPRTDIPGARTPPRLRDVPRLAIGLDGRRPAPSPPPTPTREQLVAALLGDDTDPGNDDPTPQREPEEVLDEDSDRHLSPRERANEQRAAAFRASRYGLVRLDSGVKWAGDEGRIDTLPPAAVEDE